MSFSEALGERQFVSQYSATDKVGFVLHRDGVPFDADADVTVKMFDLADPPVQIFSRTADHPAVGTYEEALNSAETDVPGIYRIRFDYVLDGNAQFYEGYLEVGEASAAYDALDQGMKGIVESAWLKFADLFDSPYGGPHLQVYFQTRFSRGRMAELLRTALGKLNTAAQPYMTYTLEGPPNGNQFPYTQWGALLEQALYIETIKHLIRSYTEMPDASSVALSRLDRRDYMDRWRTVLEMELEDFRDQFEVFKMAHMGLGRPRVLVSGGVYGDYGPTRLPLSAVARPRYWYRFY